MTFPADAGRDPPIVIRAFSQARRAARSNSLWASPTSSRTAWPSSLTSICGLAKCNQDYASVQRAMEGIDLTVEVIGCPTVCRHCWAQGIPYSTMPLADIAWVLEAVHAWCDATGLRFGAYPMHEVVAHPEAADLLRLFAHHDWRPGLFQPLVTTGVPLALRDDWREVLAAAAEIGTTIVWVAFHGMAEEHDRQVARRGAFVETCLAVVRIREAGLRVGCNVFVTKANAMQARELAETLTGLGIEQSCWELATFYPHAVRAVTSGCALSWTTCCSWRRTSAGGAAFSESSGPAWKRTRRRDGSVARSRAIGRRIATD